MLDVLYVIHNPFDEIYMTGITQADPASMEGVHDRAAGASKDSARHRRELGNSAQAILP